MDRLPPGTVYQTTLVPLPQDLVDAHIDRVAASAKGSSVAALRAREDCEAAKGGDERRGSGCSVPGRRSTPARPFGGGTRPGDGPERARCCLRYGFRVVAPFDNLRSLDAYLAHLPMAYDPERDRRNGWRYAKINMAQHIANLLPVFGRSTGTGQSGDALLEPGRPAAGI